MAKIRVKVVASKGRPCLLYRWRDPDSGASRQRVSEIPVGDNARDRKRNRGQAEREAADLAARLSREHAARTARVDMASLIDDWETHLRRGRAGDAHAAAQRAKIERIASEAGIVDLADFTAARVAEWLATAKKTTYRGGGRRRPTDELLSAQSYNHYLRAAKSFGAWLDRFDKVAKNPLAHLEPRNVDADRRHLRRAFEPAEFARLVRAAELGSPIEGVGGHDRAALYLLACWTGYRRKELASITLRSFDLDGDPPTLAVKSRSSKRRKDEWQPLHPALVERLRAWLATKEVLPLDAPILPLRHPGGQLRKTSLMVRRDLAAARNAWIGEATEGSAERAEREASDFLRYVTVDSEFADFHAQRHTFVTNLFEAGVPLAEVQQLARHSDPRLTANVYAHFRASMLAKSVAKLPAPPPAEKPRLKIADTAG